MFNRIFKRKAPADGNAAADLAADHTAGNDGVEFSAQPSQSNMHAGADDHDEQKLSSTAGVPEYMRQVCLIFARFPLGRHMCC